MTKNYYPPRRIVLSEDELTQYRNGTTAEKLADSRGVSGHTIRLAPRKQGLSPRTSAEARQLKRLVLGEEQIALYLGGCTPREIGAEIGVNEQTVLEALRRQGVPVRTYSQSRRLSLSFKPLEFCTNHPDRLAMAKGLCDRCYQAARYRDNHIGELFRGVRRRARANGIPFDITVEDITIPEVCPALEIPLAVPAWNDRENRPRRNLGSSPSLDRLIPELGYVKGNVAVISHRANTLKGNGTVEEHRRIAAWMEKMGCQ